MIFFSSNIKFLRKQKGFTQDNFAKKIGISRSLIGSYEEGRAVPKLSILQLMAKLFDISVDDLLGKDFTAKTNIKYLDISSHNDIRILPIVVNSEDKELVTVVPIKAAAGYLNGYSDPEFIETLPRFSLPLPELSRDRTYRIFQIQGDSMLPVTSGSYIITEFVLDFESVKADQSYIVVTKDDGIVFKKIACEQSKSLQVTLVSNNPVFPSYSVKSENIVELWKALGYISFVFPDSRDSNFENLTRLVLNMKQEIDTLKTTSK